MQGIPRDQALDLGVGPKPSDALLSPPPQSARETVTKMFSSSLVLESEGVQDSSFKFQGQTSFYYRKEGLRGAPISCGHKRSAVGH